ncbi:MAG: sulfite exporter TauE/SafE family protein [Bacillota bacterium]
MTLYILSSLIVLIFSAIMSMAGLGAAFIYVPLFYWLGVPLHQAMPAALLLNSISLSFASISYIKNKLVDFKTALPILVTSVLLAPPGAWAAQYVARQYLLALFAVFLVFAGSMMLFYRPVRRAQTAVAGSGAAEKGSATSPDGGEVRAISPVPDGQSVLLPGVTAGVVAGFMGGLLGVGGGNFIVPVLNWLGYEPKRASATTAFVVVFSSLSGFLGHATLGKIDPFFLLFTGVAACLGALIGSWLMQYKLTGNQLKQIIGALLYLMAGKILWELLSKH